VGLGRDALLIGIFLAGCSRTGLVDGGAVGEESTDDVLEGTTWTSALACGEPVGLDADDEGGVAVTSRCASPDGTGTLLVTRLDSTGETTWETPFPSGPLCETDETCRVAFRAPVVISGDRVYVACQLESRVATLLVLDEHGEPEPQRRIAAIRPRAWLALASDREGGIFVATETQDEVMFGERLRPSTYGPMQLARIVESGVVAWVTAIGDAQGETRMLMAERPDAGIVMSVGGFWWSNWTAGGNLVWAIGFPAVTAEAAFITGIATDEAANIHVLGRYAADDARSPLVLDANLALQGHGQGDIFLLTQSDSTFPLALGIGDASSNDASDLDVSGSGDAWMVGMGWPSARHDSAGSRPFVTFVDARRGDLHPRVLPEGVFPRFVRALPSGGAVVAAGIASTLQVPGDIVASGGILIAAFPAF